MTTIWRCTIALLASLALAAAAQEITFYYPVAVGGPITKIVDQMAADFEKENPGIKVKPVYAGSYQDTLVKALTGVIRSVGVFLIVFFAGMSVLNDAFSINIAPLLASADVYPLGRGTSEEEVSC